MGIDSFNQDAYTKNLKTGYMIDFFSIKRIVLKFLYQASRLFGADKRIVSILCYHSVSNDSNRYAVSKKIFEEEMKEISRHARFISLDEAVGGLAGNNILAPAVAVTFDDGYADMLDVLPIARKRNIPIALFVLADPDNADRNEIGNNLSLLRLDQIQYLQRQGWTIGCHGATHRNLANLSKSELVKEITNSKKELEHKLVSRIDYFAYPKGIYNESIIKAVAEAGYKAAFTIEAGLISKKANRWLLPRTIIDKTHQVSEFPTVYSPASFFARRLTNRFKLWDKFLQS